MTDMYSLTYQRSNDGFRGLIFGVPGKFFAGLVFMRGDIDWSFETSEGGSLTPLWPPFRKVVAGGPIDAEKHAATPEEGGLRDLWRAHFWRAATNGRSYLHAAIESDSGHWRRGVTIGKGNIVLTGPRWQVAIGPPAERPSRKETSSATRWAIGFVAVSRRRP